MSPLVEVVVRRRDLFSYIILNLNRNLLPAARRLILQVFLPCNTLLHPMNNMLPHRILRRGMEMEPPLPLPKLILTPLAAVRLPSPVVVIMIRDLLRRGLHRTIIDLIIVVRRRMAHCLMMAGSAIEEIELRGRGMGIGGWILIGSGGWMWIGTGKERGI
jgi:hypothetical protein